MKSFIGSFIGLVLSVSVGADPLIEGQVRLDSGEPVADAQVQIFDLTDLQRGALARAMTDGTGYFALPLAALGGHALPQGFALGPNYPNPFNPSTIIPYQLAASSEVRLEVFNLLGQRIATLVDGARPAGSHTATWHATDAAGRAVGAGVYIYRMMVGAASQTGRMVLLDGQAGVAASGAASVMSGVAGSGGSNGEEAQVYGLIVSGEGLAPYVDSAFRVETDMAPVELVVSAGPYSAGKATDDDCAFCDLFDAFGDAEEEADETEEETDETEEETDETEEETDETEEETDETEEETDETEEETDETEEETDEEEEDLIVYASVSDRILTPGQAFTLRARVQNQGTDAFQDLVLSYYRSSDAAISTQDTEVGTDPVGPLSAAGTSVESISLTASSTSGTYYYGACVASVRDEGDTLNYCSTGVRVVVADEEDQVSIPDANLRAAIASALGKAPGATITRGDMTTLSYLHADNSERTEAGSIRDLTGLEFATNMNRLAFYFHDITDISPLSGLIGLRSLTVLPDRPDDPSRLTDISPLSGLIGLTYLVLMGNQITDISSLSGLTGLTYLDLSRNQITDLSPLSVRSRTVPLERPDDPGRLTDISPLSGLTNLTHLALGRNQITDISPLSGLTNLTHLNLHFNANISDISALRGLTNLTYLVLGDNNLTDISPLSGLTNLTTLELKGQPLSVSSINDHIPALERSGATVFFDPPLRESDFDIELVFLDDHFTEKDKRAIRYAARRWESIIREDLPDQTFTVDWNLCGSAEISSEERIDDLRIYVASLEDPDIPFGAVAGPELTRETLKSFVGCTWFRLNWLDVETALHEIGHVLGLGTVWDVQDPNGDPHFNGPLAIAAFDDAGGQNYAGTKVPVEMWDEGHWRESVFGIEELMTPSAAGIGGFGAIRSGRLSAITIQALADIGYVVDVAQADPYTLPSAAAGKVSALPGDRLPWRQAPHHPHPAQAKPIHVVDPQGRIIRTLHR